MTDQPQNRQASMPSRRVALDREISIQVPAFDSFVTEYSANVSTTGMFIKSEKPLPPDTEITIEFRIAEDWKLIRGAAKVVWCRYRDEGPDQPSGMGVHFTDLEPQSKRLISWIIEKHVRDGGRPFDLDRLRGVPPEALEKPVADAGLPAASSNAATTRQIELPKAQPRRPARRAQSASAGVHFRRPSLILAGLVVAAVLYGLFWLSERGAQSVANPELPPDATFLEEEARAAPEPEPDSREEEAPAEAHAAASVPAPAPEPAPPADPVAVAGNTPASPVFQEIARRVVDGWSKAWSDQDVDAYISYYSRNFAPANGQSRSAWAANRRQRLTAPEFIQVSITGLETEVISATRGRAVFTQSYRSNSYEDTVRKVIELVREDGRWKILEEKSAD